MGKWQYGAMPKPKRKNTTIRLSKEERGEWEEKMIAYGYDELSPFARYAVRQLPRSRRSK